jgi:hypothetical protein
VFEIREGTAFEKNPPEPEVVSTIATGTEGI